MSEIAEFPLPADVTDEERATAKREIGKYAKIVGDTDDVIRFNGELIGQTGPVWHFQYTRMYKLPKGYLAAAHDLHEGIKVAYADQAEGLPKAFENPLVREFLEDELPNLQLVGRNGMHKYNNQDHSMLTAMLAVENMKGASHDVWAVNTDFEYHEEQKIERQVQA